MQGPTVGLHIRVDRELRTRVDNEASRAGMSRAALLRRLIEDALELEEERRWVAEKAGEALEEEGEPWEKVKAELGL
jgi:predicted transcriptional regulator